MAADTAANHPPTYPKTTKTDQSDNYHGTIVADPYRWLEDTDSDKTAAWVKAENAVTSQYLSQIPQRQAIERRLTELWDYERYGIPTVRGGRYFYQHNNGLQNQSVLYVADGPNEKPRVILDPNNLRDDGTVALAGTAISDDGRLLAYGLATAGSDWRQWFVRDVATGEDLSDHLQWVKFSSVSWTPDGAGFYYSRYDEPEEGAEFTGANYFQKLYYHRLGTSQGEDKLIYKRDDHKTWGFRGEVSEDGNWLLIDVWRSTEERNLVFYQDLTTENGPVQELISEFQWQYTFLGNDGKRFYFQTDDGAPKGRVIAIDLDHRQREEWETLIPETDDAIRGASIVGNQIFVNYMQDAHSLPKRFDLDGKAGPEIELPGLGTVAGFGGRRDDTQTFYSFTNFTTPNTIYQLDLSTGSSKVFRKPDVGFDSNDFETRQVFYTSRDGTRIPMYLTYKKGLEINGQVPTHLYAYGGFNISILPSFSVTNLVWLEMGGMYAVPNLRGGGEYGRQWHEAGMHDKKQNVFDDFIAAAQWLIDKGYTSPKRLAISGGSNGGLLVGACMTQRPELFAAAIPRVGVMDMLRFHKFTIGWAWVSEYGSSDDPEQFKTLLAYSPLHNLRSGVEYPATMVMTADHDDRVVPGHSFKFAATLQAAHVGKEPVLIRIESDAGHGAGTPTAKRIEEAADVLGFMSHELNMKLPKSFSK